MKELAGARSANVKFSRSAERCFFDLFRGKRIGHALIVTRYKKRGTERVRKKDTHTHTPTHTHTHTYTHTHTHIYIIYLCS